MGAVSRIDFEMSSVNAVQPAGRKWVQALT